jgi:hypothetical protein
MLFLQVPPPSPTHARHQLTLPCSFGRRCATAVLARCRRIRVHARSRAGSPPLRRCAPQHARVLAEEVEAGHLAFFPYVGPRHDVVPRLATPPWPRHGGLPHARGCREEERPLWG